MDRETREELVRIVTEPISRVSRAAGRGVCDYVKGHVGTMVGSNLVPYALPSAGRVFSERGDRPPANNMQIKGAYVGGFFGVCGLIGQVCLYGKAFENYGWKTFIPIAATNLYSLGIEVVKKAERNIQQRRAQQNNP